MKRPNRSHDPADYQITIKGKLGDHRMSRWLDWFACIIIESEADFTTLTCRQLDQSALHGLFDRIQDLGLPIISVKRIT